MDELKVELLKLIIALGTILLTSQGIRAFWRNAFQKQALMEKLMLGLAHDRILFLSQAALDKGYITHDEYENLRDYIYEPYKGLGGNGAAERILKEVEKLPLRDKEKQHAEPQ